MYIPITVTRDHISRNPMPYIALERHAMHASKMANIDTCPRPTTYVGNYSGEDGNAATVENHHANTYASWGLCFAR